MQKDKDNEDDVGLALYIYMALHIRSVLLTTEKGFYAKKRCCKVLEHKHADSSHL